MSIIDSIGGLFNAAAERKHQEKMQEAQLAHESEMHDKDLAFSREQMDQQKKQFDDTLGFQKDQFHAAEDQRGKDNEFRDDQFQASEDQRKQQNQWIDEDRKRQQGRQDKQWAEQDKQIAKIDAMQAQVDEYLQNEEFNTRASFLELAGNAVKTATFSQYNILIVDDTEADIIPKGELEGAIPVDPLKLQISSKGNALFRVHMFKSGEYLRKGSLKDDMLWVWPATARRAAIAYNGPTDDGPVLQRPTDDDPTNIDDQINNDPSLPQVDPVMQYYFSGAYARGETIDRTTLTKDQRGWLDYWKAGQDAMKTGSPMPDDQIDKKLEWEQQIKARDDAIKAKKKELEDQKYQTDQSKAYEQYVFTTPKEENVTEAEMIAECDKQTKKMQEQAARIKKQLAAAGLGGAAGGSATGPGQDPSMDPSMGQDPSQDPNYDPTQDPNYDPSQDPNYDPTQDPNYDPSQDPNYDPTQDPNYDPSQDPNYDPSQDPNYDPTQDPNYDPSQDPNYDPTQDPNYDPSQDPNYDPSQDPNYDPTQDPNYDPSQDPNYDPSQDPNYSAEGGMGPDHTGHDGMEDEGGYSDQQGGYRGGQSYGRTGSMEYEGMGDDGMGDDGMGDDNGYLHQQGDYGGGGYNGQGQQQIAY
ncbi:hypothetical protein CLCR_00009 [Cladophialophora carrionii]|uniref:Uncharacterized protein n=1 Tax=Cladophialophora carrionii TaxID=86049 RepID=A0A1C1D2V3_9EURO|nr:hypothetical protein CLCR_00009 [Cladophialophora carrionii]